MATVLFLHFLDKAIGNDRAEHEIGRQTQLVDWVSRGASSAVWPAGTDVLAFHMPEQSNSWEMGP